ncbi:hypothetical protein ACEN2J_08805 [Pseudorhodobacter sp. W20_MBD10_FR17]
MKPLFVLALVFISACDLSPRTGADPMVTGMGRTETSVTGGAPVFTF